ESMGESLRAGLRHVAESPALSVLTLLAAAGSFLAFPLITYLPVVADDVQHSGAAGYSALLTSFGLGAITGAIATAQRGNVAGRRRLLLYAFMAYGAATAGAVLSSHQSVSMALLAIGGFTLVTAFSTVNSLVQENAPGALKGRVLSIFGFAFRGGMPVGSLVAGGLVKGLGAPLVLAGFAFGLALLAAILLARRGRIVSL